MNILSHTLSKVKKYWVYPLAFILIFILLIHQNFNLKKYSNESYYEYLLYTIDQDTTININYILPEYIYVDKDELFHSFFNELYTFTIDNFSPRCINVLNRNGIYTLDDLYKICDYYLVPLEVQKVGLAFGNYFAKRQNTYDFLSQKNSDTFVNYCLTNDKFIDFLYFARVFFYNWRMDEGYTFSASNPDGVDSNGSLFFADPSASVIDIVKFFKYSKSTLPSYFIVKENIPNLYDCVPGILKNYFKTEAKYNHKMKSDDTYILPDSLDCYGFDFDGWYLNDKYEGSSIESITLKDIALLNNNNITLYAKFHRVGVFKDEIEKDLKELLK